MTDLRQQYSSIREKFLIPCASELEKLVKSQLSSTSRIDRIVSRVKSPDSFITKANEIENNRKKYEYPLTEIQDIIGLRLIVLFLSDVKTVSETLRRHFTSIEAKLLKPSSTSEFSYISWHGIFFIPSDCMPESITTNEMPKYFEIQVKTLFQHAWSEAEHDLGYKPASGTLSDEAKRMIAFAASLAWGADRAFQDVIDQKLE